jgi:hypothetical protein
MQRPRLKNTQLRSLHTACSTRKQNTHESTNPVTRAAGANSTRSRHFNAYISAHATGATLAAKSVLADCNT